MICFLDMDGVLTNFTGAATKVHGFPLEAANDWAFHKKMGLTDAQFWEPLNEPFWAGLEWMPDGKDILKAVEKVFGPDNVNLLSSPPRNPGALSGKMIWIQKHMPEYIRRFVFTPKKGLLANPARALVDDHDGNIEEFAACGGNTVLVPRPWNADRKYAGEALNSVIARLSCYRGA